MLSLSIKTWHGPFSISQSEHVTKHAEYPQVSSVQLSQFMPAATHGARSQGAAPKVKSQAESVQSDKSKTWHATDGRADGSVFQTNGIDDNATMFLHATTKEKRRIMRMPCPTFPL
jgi:hypothetical protein